MQDEIDQIDTPQDEVQGDVEGSTWSPVVEDDSSSAFDVEGQESEDGQDGPYADLETSDEPQPWEVWKQRSVDLARQAKTSVMSAVNKGKELYEETMERRADQLQQGLLQDALEAREDERIAAEQAAESARIAEEEERKGAFGRGYEKASKIYEDSDDPDLQEYMATVAREAMKVPGLEAALKEKTDSESRLRREVILIKETSKDIFNLKGMNEARVIFKRLNDVKGDSLTFKELRENIAADLAYTTRKTVREMNANLQTLVDADVNDPGLTSAERLVVAVLGDLRERATDTKGKRKEILRINIPNPETYIADILETRIVDVIEVKKDPKDDTKIIDRREREEYKAKFLKAIKGQQTTTGTTGPGRLPGSPPGGNKPAGGAPTSESKPAIPLGSPKTSVEKVSQGGDFYSKNRDEINRRRGMKAEPTDQQVKTEVTEMNAGALKALLKFELENLIKSGKKISEVATWLPGKVGLDPKTLTGKESMSDLLGRLELKDMPVGEVINNLDMVALYLLDTYPEVDEGVDGPTLQKARDRESWDQFVAGLRNKFPKS